MNGSFPIAIQTEWCAFRKSPNRGPRYGRPVVGVVFHYTAGGHGPATVKWLCEENTKRSYHIVIYRCGKAVQLVSFDRSAWHAGGSYWPLCGGHVNSQTIGIALANQGHIHCDDSGLWVRCGGQRIPYEGPTPIRADGMLFEPYTEAQFETARRVLAWLEQVGLPIEWTRHSDICEPKGYKLDPGPLFTLA